MRVHINRRPHRTTFLCTFEELPYKSAFAFPKDSSSYIEGIFWKAASYKKGDITFEGHASGFDLEGGHHTMTLGASVKVIPLHKVYLSGTVEIAKDLQEFERRTGDERRTEEKIQNLQTATEKSRICHNCGKSVQGQFTVCEYCLDMKGGLTFKYMKVHGI